MGLSLQLDLLLLPLLLLLLGGLVLPESDLALAALAVLQVLAIFPFTMGLSMQLDLLQVLG
jgi:hypothetical protein